MIEKKIKKKTHFFLKSREMGSWYLFGKLWSPILGFHWNPHQKKKTDFSILELTDEFFSKKNASKPHRLGSQHRKCCKLYLQSL